MAQGGYDEALGAAYAHAATDRETFSEAACTGDAQSGQPPWLATAALTVFLPGATGVIGISAAACALPEKSLFAQCTHGTVGASSRPGWSIAFTAGYGKRIAGKTAIARCQRIGSWVATDLPSRRANTKAC